MEERVIYGDIEITATDEFGSLEVFFSNAQGGIELGPSDDIPPLEGFKSLEEAIDAGKEFVDEHQWQFADTTGTSAIYVRKWWNDKWGYRVKPAGTNFSGFKTREEAVEAARELIKKETAKIEQERVEINVGKAMRFMFP